MNILFIFSSYSQYIFLFLQNCVLQEWQYQFISHTPQCNFFWKIQHLSCTLHLDHRPFKLVDSNFRQGKENKYHMLHFGQPCKLIANNRLRNCFLLKIKEFRIVKEKYWWALNNSSLILHIQPLRRKIIATTQHPFSAKSST